ncbi:MAG: DNA repair protein RadA, partial [Candidatus Tectomicrobia bacterium]|nr:DNA repair protein RadA [Candidatus Tectomicrobia bacterium]
MALKTKTHFSCQTCGYQAAKWMGRCPDCGEWNSFIEERAVSTAPLKVKGGSMSGMVIPQPIGSIEGDEQPRIMTGLEEFDRVLGGGVVLGSVVLIGGDPGIGKSTLLLQVSQKISEQYGSVL